MGMTMNMDFHDSEIRPALSLKLWLQQLQQHGIKSVGISIDNSELTFFIIDDELPRTSVLKVVEMLQELSDE